MKLTITTYKELEANLHAFRAGHIKFMIIYGDAGLSKSYHVKNTCKGIPIIKCHVSPLGLYTKLYKHKDEPIFMDDLDEIYNDKACVKILKAATESDDTRLVPWATTFGLVRDAGDPDDGRVPNEFYMTGPILLVSNDWSLHSANLKALGDRARLIHFRPSPAEVHRQVGTWFKDQEIYDFIGSFIPHLTHLSMRVYVNAVDAKKAAKSGLDWRQDVRQELNIEPVTVTIVELLQDKSLSQNQRAKKFTAITGHDRTTYFRRLKTMRQMKTNATLPLVAKSHDSGDAPVSCPVKVLPEAEAAPTPPTQSSTGDLGNGNDNGAGMPVTVLPVLAPPIVSQTQDQTSKAVDVDDDPPCLFPEAKTAKISSIDRTATEQQTGPDQPAISNGTIQVNKVLTTSEPDSLMGGLTTNSQAGWDGQMGGVGQAADSYPRRKEVDPTGDLCCRSCFDTLAFAGQKRRRRGWNRCTTCKKTWAISKMVNPNMIDDIMAEDRTRYSMPTAPNEGAQNAEDRVYQIPTTPTEPTQNMTDPLDGLSLDCSLTDDWSL